MKLTHLTTIALTLALAACSSTDTKSSVPAGPPVKPDAPPTEMHALQRFIGSWAGSSEMVIPEGAEMPEGPTSFPGGSRGEWALDGMFLKIDGWFEMGEMGKLTYVEYVNWDAARGQYHVVMFTDWGESGEGWWTPTADGNSMEMTFTGKDSDGTEKTGTGTMTFANDKTMEWIWTEGEMTFKGISRRQW